MSASLATFRFLLSPIYPASLAPEHLADLRKSGLTDETIRLHRIRSVPPAMICSVASGRVPRARRSENAGYVA